MSGVASSERVLASFARASHIPKDAEQWLLNCVDPCHDRLTKLTGYPDDNQSASVVQRVKQAYTIKAPSSIGTGLWDLMILNTPLMEAKTVSGAISQPGGSTLITSNVLQLNATFTQIGTYGGLMFIAVPSATNFTFSNINTSIAANTGFVTSNSLPTVYSAGVSRVIANAFEVCNTTAELTVQGSVATFRQPVQDFEDAGTFNYVQASGNTISAITPTSGLPIPGPPANLAQLMLLPGSKQWLAKEGAYVVSVLNSDRLPSQDFNYTLPIVYQNGSDNSGSGILAPVPISSTLSWSGGGTLGAVSSNFWSNFDQSGCLFTGLSPSTTLQVSWIVDVERFPTEQQADLVVIATPSTVFSPACIEAYSMIVQDLPTGVKFKENGLGEWFMDAVGSVRDVIMPTIRTAAKSNPMMGALVSVHDLVTGKGKKGKAKKDKAGEGFLSTSGNSNYKQGKPVGGKGKNPKRDPKLESYKQAANEARRAVQAAESLVKERSAKNKGTFKLPKVRYQATGRKNTSAGKPNGYRPPIPPRTAKNGGIVKSSRSYNGGRVVIEEIE